MAISSRVRSMAYEFRGYSHQLQFLLSDGPLTSAILAATGESWVVRRIILVDFARAIVAAGPPGSGNVAAVIKIARNADAARSMDHHRSALRRLRADPRLRPLLPVLPEEVAAGRIGRNTYLVEKALPGIDARNLLEDAESSTRMQLASLELIRELHGRTAEIVTVDEAMTARWIDEPLRKLRGLEATYPRIAFRKRAIDGLGWELAAALLGRRMPISWLHGDFFPGNILVSRDGRVVKGLVDWDLAASGELPFLDAMQFFMGIHLARTRSEWGPAVLALLAEGRFKSAAVDPLAFTHARLGEEPLGFREALLLTWLRHVSCNLTKSAHYSRHRYWIRSNVEAVFEGLERGWVAA
jgi:aminoglycoside phosphotransferase (APT) family kinase protein